MLEAMAPFVAYVVALGIAAVIPGPGVAAVVGRALFKGSAGSLPFILGLALGDVLFLAVAVLGLSTLAALASELFIVVKVLGGAYLIFLAWKFWTAPITIADSGPGSAQGPWMSALGGLAVTLGNPKTVVFYLALLPNLVDLGDVGLVQFAVLSVLTMLTLLAVLIPYAVFAASLKGVLRSPAALRRLNRSAAAFIGSAGGMILFDAFAHRLR